MASTYRTRFAPSPTGKMHLGHARTALVTWLRARQQGGQIVMRIEDIDRPRVVSGAADAICRDPEWLGLDWDEGPIFQSDRGEAYERALRSLENAELVYPCTCSRKDIAAIASAPHDDEGPRYPGTCRDASRGWGWQNQRLPSWRLRVAEDDPDDSGDVVLRRADGFIAYQLATVIDELTLGITDVVRGEDLQAALPAQRSLYRVMDVDPPQFHHGPLLCDETGRKLSKREASAGLSALRRQGLQAPAVIGQLAAGLGHVPWGTQLSAVDLLEGLTQDPIRAVHS